MYERRILVQLMKKIKKSNAVVNKESGAGTKTKTCSAKLLFKFRIAKKGFVGKYAIFRVSY